MDQEFGPDITQDQLQSLWDRLQ